MTDRDRLIELLKDQNCPSPMICDEKCKYAHSKSCYEERIADHLLANGVVVPPCNAGDTVYSFCDVFGAILPYVVQNFGVGFLGKDRPNYWFWEATSHAIETDELLDEIDFDLDDIGKTVFLTKEEAEAELRKRSEYNA